ncbi:ABC transporter substrate-binding protein [Streptomyces sp. NPDC059909]|uniref:ABC transporter substrate-binding protein n=1 Tax=Streptomyces sp. NPDC059909 TaxID=3346998 RepID=UPI003646203A
MVPLLIGALSTACAGLNPEEAESEAEGGMPQVIIGKAVDSIGFTTVEVAQEKGYFKKEGVAVQQELLGGSSTAFAALQSGEVQFVTASSTALLNARVKDVPLQAVASLDYGTSLQMLGSNKFVKEHKPSPDQSVETTMKQLEGGTLGVVSTTDVTYYRYLMDRAGVGPDKYKIITVKSHAAGVAALDHSQIDAFLLSPPSTYFAESQGKAKIIAKLHDVPDLRDMTYDILVTSTSYAESHPDVVKSVARAMAQSDKIMGSDPEAVLAIEREHYPEMSDEVLLDSLKYVNFPPDGKMTQERWEKVRDLARLSDVPGAADVDLEPDKGTWTNRYLE